MTAADRNARLKLAPKDYCPAGTDRWFELEHGPDAGRSLFYADITLGQPPQQTVLLVHGNPESSYRWRGVRDSLIASGQNVRLILPDHLGFGLSDPASFEMIDMHHAANLRQLVAHLDLQDIIVVLHDWGGPIGAGALMDSPERVAGIVVANSTVFPMPADGYRYTNYPFPWLPWSLTPRLVPDALWGGVAAAVVSHAKPQNTMQFLHLIARWLWRYARKAIPAGTPEHVWSQPMRLRINARSSKRQVRQTPVWGHGYQYTDTTLGPQDNRDFYRQLQAVLPDAWGRLPAAGHFGQWDPCGKNSVIDQWLAALPRMADDLHRYADCGHFIEKDQPTAIAQSILRIAARKP